MFILDIAFLIFSIFVFFILSIYFISYSLTISLYIFKTIIFFNFNEYISIMKNVLYFTPLILINVTCIFLFLIIFLLFVELEYLKILEVYYYFRYICHPKTISIILSYIPIKDNIKFFPMIISFIIVSNIYEFINTYKILSYKYKYTNQQFHISDKHVRYQIVSSLILLRVSDIMSNHQILITDASHIIDMFRDNNIIFHIIERYELVSTNFLDEKYINNSNYNIYFSALGIIEFINMIVYILLIKFIKRRFI